MPAHVAADERRVEAGPRGEARRRPRLRTYLVGLVLAVLVPCLALGGATAWSMAQSYRRAFEDRLLETAHALALAADAEIGAVLTAAETLAASPLLDDPSGLPAFDAQARRVGEAFGSWVVVTDSDLRQVVNTRLLPGEPLPRAFGPAAIAEVLRIGRPRVGNLVTLPFRSGPVASVMAPVLRDGASTGMVVVVPVLPARLLRLLEPQARPGGTLSALMDGSGMIVARSRRHEELVGTPAPAGVEDAIAGQESGLLSGPSRDGFDVVFAFQRLASAPGWFVIVAEPLAAYRASWKDPLLGLAAGGLAAFALALVLAAWLTRQMLLPLRALVRRAEALAASCGESRAHPPEVPPAPVAEFEALRIAGARAEAALGESEAQLRRQSELLASVTDNAAEAIFLLDAEGRTTFANPAAERMFGWSGEELRGRVLRDLVHHHHPDGRPLPVSECPLGVVFTSGGNLVAHENVFFRRDGSPVPVSCSNSAIGPGGKVAGAVLVVRDITERKRAEEALRASEARLRAITDNLPAGMVYQVQMRGDGSDRRFVHLSGRCEDLTGVPVETALADPGALYARIVPEDREALSGAEETAIRALEPFEFEARLMHARTGEVRWCRLASAPRKAPGDMVVWDGLLVDVTERKRAEERQALLTSELDHRAKNMLAVVQAALRLAPRDDVNAYAAAVEGRVRALARAHTLLAAKRWEGADLRELAAGELATFLSGTSGITARVAIEGPDVKLSPAAAQAVSMALHELATNATKYGALSAPDGRVRLSWELDVAQDILRLCWSEAGGPIVEPRPSRRGFGSRVIEATLRDQLGGRLERHWRASGLVCEVELPLPRVMAARAAAMKATGV